jgi:hypothetical protein
MPSKATHCLEKHAGIVCAACHALLLQGETNKLNVRARRFLHEKLCAQHTDNLQHHGDAAGVAVSAWAVHHGVVMRADDQQRDSVISERRVRDDVGIQPPKQANAVSVNSIAVRLELPGNVLGGRAQPARMNERVAVAD